MRIRRARREDVPAIVTIYGLDALRGAREKIADPLPDIYFEAFAVLDANAEQLLLVAEQDSVVIGTLQLTFVQHLLNQGMRRAVLEAMFVHPDHRGSGVGSAMVRFAMKAAREARCGSLELTSNKSRDRAHRFYERLGFRATHEGFKLAL